MSQTGVPKTIGGYEIQSRLASGGMAEIFLARTRGFGGFEKRLVIKRLHEEHENDESFVRMLIDEARITAQLQHANIVQVLDLGMDGDQVFMAMELVDGRDLYQVLRELHKRDLHMPIEAACFIVAELCLGLDYAHTRRDPHTNEPLGIVHRDVSPQNVLLSWHGEVKLGDFGIVKATGRSTHTQTGVIKGKFYYMSPEQARGISVDRRSDIFSAGIVLYEALTASPLYDETDDTLLLERVRQAGVRAPSSVREDVPAEVDALCAKALARDPERRFTSGMEMARALNAFIGRRGRSFTKTDLADFLAALFDPNTHGAEPATKPGDAEADAAALDADAVFGRTDPELEAPHHESHGDVSGDRSTVAIARAASGPPNREPPRARVLEAPGPPASGAQDETEEQTRDLRRVARQPEPSRSPELAGTAADKRSGATARPDPLASEMTSRLSRADIAALNEQILATMRAKSQEGGAARPMAVDLTEPPPDRPGGQARSDRASSRPPAGHPRDSQMRLLLALVTAAILGVAIAIVWLVTHPIAVAEAAGTGNTPALERPVLKSPIERTAKPSRDATPALPAEGATDADSDPMGTVRIVPKPANRKFKLYVDGQLETPRNGQIRVSAGRHSLFAKLQPEGTQTPDVTLEVFPNRVVDYTFP